MTFQQFTTCGDGGVNGVEDNGNGDGDGGYYDSVDGYFGDDNAEIIVFTARRDFGTTASKRYLRELMW